jgi:hypothetical protein
LSPPSPSLGLSSAVILTVELFPDEFILAGWPIPNKKYKIKLHIKLIFSDKYYLLGGIGVPLSPPSPSLGLSSAVTLTVELFPDELILAGWPIPNKKYKIKLHILNDYKF